MSSVPFGIELGRDDVLGRRLVAIVQSDSLNQVGMDWVYTFFRLDSGATFCLPCEDAAGFVTEEPKPASTSLDHPDIKPVIRQRIMTVLRRGPEADHDHDSPYLVMENGYVVTDVMGDYHGTASAGLYIYPPTEIDTSKMVDFFG